MFHHYILVFPLYYYISVLRIYTTPPTFCLDLCWAISFYSLLPLHVYKDCSLPWLSSLVNMKTLIPITYSTGYRRDPLLFEISDFYCAPITPLYIDFRYTWNVPSHRLWARQPLLLFNQLALLVYLPSHCAYLCKLIWSTTRLSSTLSPPPSQNHVNPCTALQAWEYWKTQRPIELHSMGQSSLLYSEILRSW